jgi:hypothetical protein
MTKPTSSIFVFTIVLSIVSVCATIPAFSQRGGGSHGGGGGFHGGSGGGFHGGGGGPRGGGSGGSVSRAPQMRGGISRGVPSAPPRAIGGSHVGPSGYANRPNGNSTYANERVVVPSAAPRAYSRPDGLWHAFGGIAASRGAVVSPSEARGSSNTGAGGQVFGANRSAGIGPTRSFSGQGRDIWENAPAARNVVPAARALSSIQNSFSNSVARNSAGSSNASLFAGSRLGGTLRTQSSVMAFGTRSTFGRGVISSFPRSNNGLVQFRSTVRFGFPFRSFHRGCWNCRFGFGLGFSWWPGWGWGFGWPLFGFWNWDPFWGDPWLWGWPGNGYYGYPTNYNMYNYTATYDVPSSSPAPTGNYASADQSAPTQQGSPDTNTAAVSGENPAGVVPLFLKDGTVYAARNFWLTGGRLHYTVDSGAESSIDMDQLDMQRTVDENAKHGVQFTLKPSPNGSGPAHDTNNAPQNRTDSRPDTDTNN